MFTWICPKCGTEVPPSYSECPNCSGTEKTEKPAAEAPSTTPATEAAQPAAVRRKSSVWPALLVMVLMAAVLIGGGALYLHFRPNPTASQAVPDSSPSASFQTPTTPPSNLAVRNLELTALRLTEDSNQKAILQFVVVNHSAADLGEIHAQCRLKAVANGKEQSTVGTFVFKATMGPYESKEFKVPVETKLRVYEFPDWQFLRAEIIGQ